MFIQSEHIYLRALESSDIDMLYQTENDKTIWQISNTITPFSKDILELYLQSAHQDLYTTKQLRLVICLVKTNEPIGTIDLFDFEPMHQRVGIGILIFENFRKNRFAFESIQLIKEYTKNILLLNQLYCNISSTNTESIHLFEKCEFQLIGTKKEWNRLVNNQFEDELMYQLIL
jgi:diamine N-acetyltransferase